MTRAHRTALPVLALILGACATSASESTGTSTSLAPSTAPADDEVCVGPNAQQLDIDEPTLSFGHAWNEPDDDARLALLTQVLTEDARLAEPTLPEPAVGRRAVADRIGDFHDTRPGEYFEWQAEDLPEAHHDRLRMPWRICDAAGATLLEGTAFMLLTPDGLIADATTFHPPE